MHKKWLVTDEVTLAAVSLGVAVRLEREGIRYEVAVGYLAVVASSTVPVPTPPCPSVVVPAFDAGMVASPVTGLPVALAHASRELVQAEEVDLSAGAGVRSEQD